MKSLSAISELFGDFLALVFPKVCIHCGTPLIYQEEHLCTTCRLDLPKTDYHLVPDNPLKEKLIYEPKVQSVAAYLHFHKRGVAQSIIHHLKYKGFQELGQEIGNWYGAELKAAQWPVDLVIPVPLHRSKLKRRGYNQSELFAEGIAGVLGVPVETQLVTRKVRTNTQTRKTRVQRLENVASIYQVEDVAALANKNVLLVDDVLTTGATIGELAMLLGKTEVNKIHVAAIAAGG